MIVRTFQLGVYAGGKKDTINDRAKSTNRAQRQLPSNNLKYKVYDNHVFQSLKVELIVFMKGSKVLMKSSIARSVLSTLVKRYC